MLEKLWKSDSDKDKANISQTNVFTGTSIVHF